MRRLYQIRRAQFCDQAVEAGGETLDVKVERIVVTVDDLRIDRGMECGDEPVFGTHAGNHVEEREPIMRRGGIISLCRNSPFNSPPNSAACSNLVSRHGIE